MTASVAVAGVYLNRADAALLAQTLDALAVAGERHGFRLPPRAVALGRFLADAATYGDISASVQPDHDLVSSVVNEGDQLIDTTTAATHLGCSKSNIRDLVRRGRLEGIRHNGRWLIHAESLRDYKRSR